METFARTLSPYANAGSDERKTIKTIGSGTSPFQSTGLAKRSPSLVLAIICKIQTLGSWFGFLKDFLFLSISPLKVNSFKTCFNSTRMEPFILKALAISRLLDFFGLSLIQSRICFFVGNLLINKDCFFSLT